MIRNSYILLILMIFALPVMAQKSQKECIDIIKRSYKPFETLLKKDANLRYLEYKMSTCYYNSDNKKQVQASKVSLYSKGDDSFAFFDKKEVYRYKGNIVAINNGSKSITIAKDTYDSSNNGELIKNFFYNRDTLFSCITDYKYETIRIDSGTYHKITFYLNDSEQKYQKIKKVQWIIDARNNEFCSMEMFYVKTAKYFSSTFEVLTFEIASNRADPFEKDILKEIYGANGVVQKKYASYRINDYIKQ